jgi:hypothetical protein
MRTYSALICGLLIALTACSDKTKQSPEKPITKVDSHCSFSTAHLCVIPFQAIYSLATYNPDNFYGIKGFLMFENGEYALYPTKESMDYGIKESAILINCSCDMNSIDISQKIGEHVNLVGYFSHEFPHNNHQDYWAVIETQKPPNILGEFVRAKPAAVRRAKK